MGARLANDTLCVVRSDTARCSSVNALNGRASSYKHYLTYKKYRFSESDGNYVATTASHPPFPALNEPESCFLSRSPRPDSVTQCARPN